jgi:V/A-type H+/Na+-transporting ATPase subunit I
VFRSEKLVRITVQTPEQFISAVTGVIARLKLLHLIRIDETHLGRLGYVADTDGSLLKEYEQFFEELEKLLALLQVRPDGVPLDGEVIPEKDIFKVRERFQEIRAVVETDLGELGMVEASLREKKALLDRFKLLPDELDFTPLNQRHYIRWLVGLVPALGLEKLEESLSERHHAVIELGTVQDRTVIVVFGLKKDWETFKRALQGALLEPLEIPEGASGTVDALVADLEREIARLQEKVQGLAGQRQVFQRQFRLELLTLREKAVAARQMLAARRLFGKIDKSFLISGWIPERLFAVLEPELNRVTAGQVVIEKVDPEDLREVREGIVKIPILFNNPMLISPFEKLTSLYGTPRYREVEPTIFFALSFLLLFGMMFGDVGQGGVLFLLGYLMFRRSYKYLDYGIILMECGVSSMLFGLLYGSVFGLESVFPALWFRPMDNIPYFIKVALSLGVALISLGLVLNLINALRLKEYENLLGAGGLAGALLYWMSAGLGMKYLLTGQVAPGELSLLGWAAALLLTVMILHRPLYRLLVKREPPKRIVRQSGFLTGLIESVIEVFDDLLRFVANTVSFLRVAAFALSHAALFTAVFSIARVVAQEQRTGVSYWLVVAVGNLIIIFLEGLVVSIQTVRLEYYEFFGKFFRGGGERFRSFDKEIGPAERKS